LGALFNLKLEKQNGTYIFNGTCPEKSQMRRMLPPAEDLLQGTGGMKANRGPTTTEVFFPIMPLTR
jgi:hypothetical protein